jgi:peptide/nickel transport system permease protein
VNARSVAVGAAQSPRGNAVERAGLWRRLLGRPLGVICVAYLALIAGVAIVAPFALPAANAIFGDAYALHQAPTWHHLLGTDTRGRDVLDRLLVGTRMTMLGVAEALIVALAIGVPAGLAAGFLGKWTERTIGWLTDLGLALPGLIFVIVAASIFPGNLFAPMCVLGAVLAPGLARVVRAATLPVRGEVYIMAARVSGLSRPSIISREVLSRISGVVVVQASLVAGTALLTQCGLAVLSLLAPPSLTPLVPAGSNWGGMIGDGISVIYVDPWLIWPPGITVALTVLALVLLGDVVRDVMTDRWSAPSRPSRHRSNARRLPTARWRGSLPAAAAIGLAETRALLSVEGLGISFATSAHTTAVVEDVTFDIQAGETVGLMGESGCGKTVTAMSIIGLLPHTGQITAGRILFDGQDLATFSERELRRVRGAQIGLISQDPMVALTPVYRIGWQVAEVVRRHASVSRSEAHRRALELLDRVRLPDPEAVADRFPHELSGGMAQRVSLAAALAGDPKLLIADEPTTALDVTVQAEILELLRELQRDTGMAILLITHDGSVVADICDRAVVMYAGQVVERAETTAFFDQPLHPYTQALLRSNPHYVTTASRLPTIPGTVPQPGGWPSGCHFHPRCDYATAACRKQPIPLEHPDLQRETRCVHYRQLLTESTAQ